MATRVHIALLQEMLEPTGVSLADAVRFICNVLDCRRSLGLSPPLNLHDELAIYQLGLKTQQEMHRSEPFDRAVERFLRERADCGCKRTCAERRSVLQRILRSLHDRATRPLRAWTADDCRSVLSDAFPTPYARRKGHCILNGLFLYARRRGWCSSNPMDTLSRPRVSEREIAVLSLPQVRSLVRAAAAEKHSGALAAVLLMLWCGVRPTEMARLTWGEVDPDNGCLYLRGKHSKTGGPRHIPLRPVILHELRRIRRELTPAADARITPPNWTRHWRELRVAAQLHPWRPDTLRHSFASYHCRHFQNLTSLQLEMGHSDQRLLQTRYINLRGLTAQAAAAFWSPTFLQSCLKRR